MGQQATLQEFDGLDSEQPTWLIPAARSKNGRAHLVPLSPLAIAIVREAQALNAPGEMFLFPSPAAARGPIDSHALSVAMARFGRELSGDLEAIRTWQAEAPSPHDLRRTCATRLAALGVSGEDVAALLNHAPRGVTAVHYNLYSRASEKRRALTLWAAALEAMVGEAREPERLTLI